MPLPTPSKESKMKKSEWISKCMGDPEANKKFTDPKQRAGYCYTQWKQVKGEADLVIQAGQEETLFFDEAKKISQKEREKMAESDFVIPSNKSFPITDCQSVKNAVSSFGRGGTGISFDAFKKRLVEICRRKGLTQCLPDTIKEEYKIK